MVQFIIPPRRFNRADFERRYALEQAAKTRELRSSDRKRTRALKHRSRIVTKSPVRNFSMFKRDVQHMLEHGSTYKLERGDVIVRGQSFSFLRSSLRSGLGESGWQWSIPSQWGVATDLLIAAGARVTRGQHSRSYWGPNKWGAPCDVVYWPSQEG